MINNTALAIGMMSLEPRVPEEGTLEERLLAVMRAAPEAYFFAVDDEEVFQCAIGAVMHHYGEDSPEWQRLTHELEGLKLLNAGLTVGNISAAVDHMDVEDAPEPVGIMKFWRQARAEEKART